MDHHKNQKNPVNKKTVMLLLIILPIAIGTALFFGKRGETANRTDSALYIPDVDSDAAAETPLSKDQLYAMEREQQEQDNYQLSRNMTSDRDFFALDPTMDTGEKSSAPDHSASTTTPSSSSDESVAEVLAEYEKITPQSTPSNSSGHVSSNAPARSSAPTPRSAKPDPPQAAAPTPEVKPVPRSSMGVYIASGKNSGNSLEETVSQSGQTSSQYRQYITAILEEDKTIQNGSSITFILAQDSKIGGILHKRGSIIYGNAINKSDYFEIQIRQLKSANDNKNYPVSMTLYDENYNLGIRSEGMLNENVRREGVDAATQQVDDLAGSATVGMLDAATRALTRTVSRTSRSKPISITLMKGYRVYLAENSNEK